MEKYNEKSLKEAPDCKVKLSSVKWNMEVKHTAFYFIGFECL